MHYYDLEQRVLAFADTVARERLRDLQIDQARAAAAQARPNEFASRRTAEQRPAPEAPPAAAAAAPAQATTARAASTLVARTLVLAGQVRGWLARALHALLPLTPRTH